MADDGGAVSFWRLLSASVEYRAELEMKLGEGNLMKSRRML